MKIIILLLCLLPAFCFSQTDTLVVEVIYGSKPLAKSEAHWFGGKLGGHIGLRIGQDSIMHFLPGGRVNATNANSDTGRYIISTEKQFYRIFAADSLKTCRIFIPISPSQKQLLLSDSKAFLEKGPYPYSLFGMRCAAACYHLLSLANVTEDLSQRKMTWKFIYPRKLRKYLFREAEKTHWKITRTAGAVNRKWDHH